MISFKLIFGLALWMSVEESCIFIVHDNQNQGHLTATDSSHAYSFKKDSLKPSDTAIIQKNIINKLVPGSATIDTRNVQPQEVLQFARTLIGTRYKYGSSNPKEGFDCSGFITYVFSHFGIIVPRSSIDFTSVGNEVSTDYAKAGDLILFTGTDSTERFVGHMGLVESNKDGQLNFIHSSSGKIYGVTITPLNAYYKGRFMKIIRIFPQNY
jgi:cell wall-associated NlpC family hydrolase